MAAYDKADLERRMAGAVEALKGDLQFFEFKGLLDVTVGPLFHSLQRDRDLLRMDQANHDPEGVGLLRMLDQIDRLIPLRFHLQNQSVEDLLIQGLSTPLLIADPVHHVALPLQELLNAFADGALRMHEQNL